MSVFDISRLDIELATILRCAGQIDAHSFHPMRSAFNQALAEKRYWLVVNMANVDYMSSSGISVLLAAQSEIEENKGKIVLVGLQPKVRQVLELMSVMPLFTDASDEDTALASF